MAGVSPAKACCSAYAACFTLSPMYLFQAVMMLAVLVVVSAWLHYFGVEPDERCTVRAQRTEWVATWPDAAGAASKPERPPLYIILLACSR